MTEPWTPGPWEWKEVEGGEWGDSGPNLRSIPMGRAWDEFWGPDRMGLGKNHAEHPPVPNVVSAWGHDAWGVNVEPADARLIALAPEMAALLAQIAEQMGHTPEPDSDL